MERISGDVYDHPKYYDLVFGSDWRAEFEFLTACFEAHARCPIHRLYEPACGTGRLMYRLGRAGYEVVGCDLNAKAVDYCNRRLKRHSLAGEAHLADMATFQVAPPADAAFNMINSFRHLADEDTAQAHLRSVCESLQSGGLYVLGLHLTPIVGAPSEAEAWSARKGNLCVNTSMWNTLRDLDLRIERYEMTYDVFTPTRSFQLQGELVLRTYTRTQFNLLLETIPKLQVVGTYDFGYDIATPLTVTDASEDVVYVLRKAV